jgi:hypothetical protein
MPLYNCSPFETVPLARPGSPVYLFGSYDDKQGPTRFLVTQSQGNGTTTVTGVMTEGPIPQVGDLITISGASNPDLQVSCTPITAVGINSRSGKGTISFASGNEPPQVPIIQANWQPTWAGCMFSSVPALDDNDVITFDGFVSPTPSYLNGRSYTVMTIPGGGLPPDLNHAAWDGTTSLNVRHQGDQIGDFFYDPLAHITIGSPLGPSPAVAIITRKPVLETVENGYRSIVVAIPDSPEGHSIQGFSIDVIGDPYMDGSTAAVSILLGNTPDSMTAIEDEWHIGGNWARYDYFDKAANFVSLSVGNITGFVYQIDLAARLLVR